jgi:two-component SAPR family response regulator
MPAKIVIVHNEVAFSTPLATILDAAGHTVSAFADPITALDALEAAEKAEVLVTRVNFGPGKPHGVALARMARSKRPSIQVLFIGMPDEADHTDGLGAFLPAPGAVPEVVRAVERLLTPTRGT